MLTALLALAAAAADSDGPIATFGTWKLYSQSDVKQCEAINRSSKDDYIILGYDAVAKHADITFTNKHASSLKEGDERGMRIIFVRGNELDNSGRDINFKATIEPDGSRMLMSQTLPPSFLDEVAKSRAVSFWFGHNVVGIFSLKDTGKLIPALRQCAIKAAGIDPKDPFAS